MILLVRNCVDLLWFEHLIKFNPSLTCRDENSIMLSKVCERMAMFSEQCQFCVWFVKSVENMQKLNIDNSVIRIWYFDIHDCLNVV